MDPHKTLFETSLVRMAISIPLVLAVGTSILILLDPSTREQMGLGSFSQIQATYKTLTIPFLILSLAIPFTALVAGHHRSLQSRHQIKIQDDQNIFSNYVKHRELFIDFFNNTDPFQKGVKDSNEIYGIVFPNSAEGVFSPGENIVPGLQIEIGKIYKNIIDTLDIAISSDSFKLNLDPIKEQVYELDRIYQRFWTHSIVEPGITFEDEGFNILRSSISRTEGTLIGLHKCCNFLRSYFPNKEAFSAKKLRNEIFSRLDKLSPRFHVWHQVKVAIDRHLTLQENGSLKKASSPLPMSLRNVHHNNNLYLMEARELKAFINNVVVQNLPDNYLSIFLDYLPQEWREALNYEDISDKK